MSKKTISLFLVAMVTCSVVFTGCSAKPAEGDPTPEGQKRDSINLRLDGEVSTLDSNNSFSLTNGRVMAQIYDTLYFVDMEHNVEPRLAESHVVSEDSLTYTFKLKEGVKFHNGEELKASDVVFTLNRALTSAYLYSVVEQIESTTVIDDYSFSIKLKNIYAPFIETLSALWINNEKAVTEAGATYGENPVGTGPYKFVSYEGSSVLKLTRFDEYFRGPARIKDVNYKVITDINTATIALETGELDMSAFSSASYENVKNNKNLKLQEVPSAHLMFVMMNTEKAPFDNKLIRQAVNYCMDKDFIIDVAADGLADISPYVLNDRIFGFSDKIKPYEYNIEKAKELVAQSGIPSPINIGPIKTIDGSFKKIAQVLQENLAEIGIITEIELLEQNKYVEDAISGNYEIGIMGTELTMDADNFSMYLTPENIGGNNMARYNNPEVNQLFQEGRSTLDSNQRLEIYEKLFQIVQDDAPYAPLYNGKAIMACNKDLTIDHQYPIYNFIYDYAW